MCEEDSFVLSKKLNILILIITIILFITGVSITSLGSTSDDSCKYTGEHLNTICVDRVCDSSCATVASGCCTCLLDSGTPYCNIKLTRVDNSKLIIGGVLIATSIGLMIYLCIIFIISRRFKKSNVDNSTELARK